LENLVQIGTDPGCSFADWIEIYGVGAFLASGSKIKQMMGGQ